MQRTDRHQIGFGVLQVLLAIVVVGALAGTSWVVYQHNRVTVTDAAPSGGQTTSQHPTPAPTLMTVHIPELGIQLAVPDALKDLTYHVTTVTLRNGNQATLAMFSTATLTAADAQCGPDAMPLGSLERVDGQYPTAFSDATPPLDYGLLVKQFPTFYVAAGYPQAACSQQTIAQGLASAARSEFDQSELSVQPLN